MINTVDMVGIISSTTYGSRYPDCACSGTLQIKRTNGHAVDEIPFAMRGCNPSDIEQHFGMKVHIKGHLASINVRDKPGKRKLLVYVEVTSLIRAAPDEEDKNVVVYEGTICREPDKRLTKAGTIITDYIVAHNWDKPKRSFYIPCIAWDKQAELIALMNISEQISVTGRLQSRNYLKQLNNGTIETRITYELSTSSFTVM